MHVVFLLYDMCVLYIIILDIITSTVNVDKVLCSVKSINGPIVDMR